MDKEIEITLKKSLIGKIKKHHKTVHALGLRKIGQTVRHKRSPQIMGMVNQVGYLLDVKSIGKKKKKGKK